MKKCPDCDKTLELTDFHRKSEAKDGLQSRCKECNKARARKWQADNPDKHSEYWRARESDKEGVKESKFVKKARRYGVSVPELQKMFEEADNKCQICKEAPLRWLVVDHCHDSLKVRGLLCERCNQGLGLFRDNVEFMKTAIEYLQK